MADRIQQRRDTRARWEEFNPLLLEGEVGYVTDDPNLYKIGDGVNRWNSLPYRGFDGTITQETGNSENAVMSQKAVTEKLSELGSNLSVNIVSNIELIGATDVVDVESNCILDASNVGKTLPFNGFNVYTISNNDTTNYKNLYVEVNLGSLNPLYLNMIVYKGDDVISVREIQGNNILSIPVGFSIKVTSRKAPIKSYDIKNVYPTIINEKLSPIIDLKGYELVDGILHLNTFINTSGVIGSYAPSAVYEVNVADIDLSRKVFATCSSSLGFILAVVCKNADGSVNTYLQSSAYKQYNKVDVSSYITSNTQYVYLNCLTEDGSSMTKEYAQKHLGLYNKANVFASQKDFEDTSKRIENEIGEIRDKTVSSTSSWAGKKVLFLGTSIPAGNKGEVSVNGYKGQNNYPKMIGSLLGCTVYNEAVGSSPLRAYNPRTGNFKGMPYDSCLKALCQTIEDKRNLIDNWSSGLDSNGNVVSGGTYGWRDLLTMNPPTDYNTFASEGTILGWSYENKVIAKYFDSSSEKFVDNVDVVIIEHAHNDIAENYYIGPGDRYYDDTLDQCSVFTDNYTDRSRFPSSLSYLIQEIYKRNPRQKIIVFGHYSDDTASKIDKDGVSRHYSEWIVKAQENASKYWNLPIVSLWKNTAWNQKKIVTDGYWNNGNWVASGGENREMPIYEMWMADKLHPHSDNSGRANYRIAEIASSILKSIY